MSKVQDVTADPSAATDQIEQSYQERMATWTPEQRRQFALTGEEPEAKPEPKTKPAATPEGAEPKPEPDKGLAKEVQEPKEKRDSSWRLQRKIGELSAENRRLQRELEAKASRSNVETTEQKPSGKPVRPIEPDFTEFDTVEDYRKARKDYQAKLSEYDTAIEQWNFEQWERQQQEKTAAAERETAAQTQIENFDKRAATFAKEHKDYGTAFEQVLSLFKEAKPEQVLIDAVLESDFGPQLIHRWGTEHLEELESLLDMSTTRALRELGKIEANLEKVPKPITQTKAPAPGTRVQTNSQVTGDAIEDAYARGDFALGARLEAERDAARKR